MSMEEAGGLQRTITASDLMPELEFSASRSGGPGGQNVNKVNTKITLRFDVQGSSLLSEDEKRILTEKLASKLTTEGVLIIASQEKRSQPENKEEAIRKLDSLLKKAGEKKKKRKKSKPSKAAREKRLQFKKKNSEKKQWRKKL